MGSIERYHTIGLKLMWLPDKQVINAFIKFCNAAGCIPVVDVSSHTAEIHILDSKFKHTVHEVEVEVEDEGTNC